MIDELADLLLGACCPGCSRPGLGLCDGCRAALGRHARPVLDAVALPPGLRACHTDDYVAPVSELLSAHKDRGAWGLRGVLSAQLAVSVAALLRGQREGPVVLVPVPSSPAAVRRRGYDHSRALARGAALILCHEGWEVRVVPALRRTRRVGDQSGLGREQRGRNQHGTMAAAKPLAGVRVVITDDICTTGASLAEAVRALRERGWRVTGAAVVAHPTQTPARKPLKLV